MMELKKGNRKEKDNYPHQTEIADILERMEKKFGSFSTIVDVPTGGGKTKIAIDFCARALESDRSNKVLWLSGSIDLLMQSIEKFGEKSLSRDISCQLICSTAIFCTEGSIHLKRSAEKPVNSTSAKSTEKSVNAMPDKIDANADILFASIETIRKYNDKEDKFSQFTKWLEASQCQKGKLYIIYDEVHHIGAEEINEFLNKMFKANNRDGVILKRYAFVGLTATVYRYNLPIESFNRWFKHGWNKNEWDKDDSYLAEDRSQLGMGDTKSVNNRISIVGIRRLMDNGILPCYRSTDKIYNDYSDRDFYGYFFSVNAEYGVCQIPICNCK